MKHQSNCYRTIGSIKFTNFCDLIMSEEEIAEVVAAAKNKYKYVRKIKHPSGYYQLFISNEERLDKSK